MSILSSLRASYAEAVAIVAEMPPLDPILFRKPKKTLPEPTLNLPKCPFCGDAARQYKHGHQTFVNSRIQTPRVKMLVQCLYCDMRMTATRYPGDRRWTFYASP